MKNTPQFEVPAEMRMMAEKSLEQVKNSIEVYLRFIQRSVPTDGTGSAELSNKVFDYANRNVTSAFEFAKRLMQVTDARQLASMQSEFVQAQIQAIAEQSDGLSESARKALMNSVDANPA